MPSRDALLVIGHGMVGHRLVTSLVEAGGLDRWDITVVGEEPRPAYDRIALSSLFSGASPADLCLVEQGLFDQADLRLLTGEPVVAIDPDARTATMSAGHILRWDALVLATGSVPFVPPLPGRDATGCFVYRTTEDVEAIRAYAAGRQVGGVIGGGLLGLEAAGGLRSLGMDTHVVEFAPRLMPVQLDADGGAVLRRHIEGLGVHVHTGARTAAVDVDEAGRVRALKFEDGTFDIGDELACDVVVFFRWHPAPRRSGSIGRARGR